MDPRSDPKGGSRSSDAPADDVGSTPLDAGARVQPRLRLIMPPASPLTTLVERVEAEYADCHNAMLGRLSLLEGALPACDAVDLEGALEQIAFVRVGFRCIADAIGELAQHAARLDAHARSGSLPLDGGAP